MKKALALLLVLVLALGMSTVAFAAKVDKDVKNQTGVIWYGGNTITGAVSPTGALTVNDDQVDLGTFAPGDAQATVSISLKAANFIAASTNGTTIPAFSSPTGTLSTREIKDSKMVAKFKASKGSQVIDTVEIDGTNVKVEFVDPFPSNNTDGVDFTIRVYLVVDGKNWTDKELTLVGTYANDYDDTMDADTDYFDFSDGQIMKPSEFIRMFDGDLGEGVIANMRGLKNAKYWGVANQDITDADQEVFIKYPSVDQVFHVQQIGMTAVVNFVTLEDADPTAYVYDKDMNYLGRGNAHLPLSDTYYLAAAELDVDTDEDEPEDEEEEEEEYDPGTGGNAGTGGDDLYPENSNDNPGTGK